MANKRYYWLKLKEDFFDDDTMKWLESQKNGKDYALFYLKLCLKSLKTNGVLIQRVGKLLIPYTPEALADLTKTEIDTVLVAMEIFKKTGMVEILDAGEIFISQLQEMVGSETDKAAYMRKLRANKSEKLPVGNNVTQLLPECNTEKERDKEKEKDSEKESEKEGDTEEPAPPLPVLPPEKEKVKVNCQEVVDLYNKICVSLPSARELSDARRKAISSRVKKYGLDKIVTVFQNAEASSFLKGGNNRNWNADFDWLLKEGNLIKVLEGNYADRPKRYGQYGYGQPQPIGEWEREAVRRMMAENFEDDEDAKTVGNDPELAERAEKLKQELTGAVPE